MEGDQGIPEEVKVEEANNIAKESAETERKEIIKKLELDQAVGFRLALDEMENQVESINKMRDAGIISFPEDEKTALGYLRSQEEVRAFIEIAHDYPGLVSFGGSRGDSRVWLVQQEGTIDRLPIVATSTATNAAARALEKQGTRTEGLSIDEMSTYRYAPKGQAIEEGAEEAEGAKGTRLEKKKFSLSDLPERVIEVDEEGGQFVIETLVNEHLLVNETHIDEAVVGAILGLDLIGFSGKFQELMEAGSAKEAEEYLEEVVSFLAAFERRTNEKIKSVDPEAVLHAFEWRGDTAAMMANDVAYADLMQLAFEETLQEYDGRVAARAAVMPVEDILVRTTKNGVLMPQKVDRQMDLTTKKVDERLEQSDAESGVLNTCGLEEMMQLFGRKNT